MSNLFHEIKHGFLILGFTGPLSSGCTTSAKFFELELNDYINSKKKTIKRIATQIPFLYEELNNLKKQLDNWDSLEKKAKLKREIEEVNTRLKARLDLRETLEILQTYEDKNNFKYISMTDVLLKLVIENILEKKYEEKEELKKILSLTINSPLEISDLKDFNNNIRERDFSKYKKKDFADYEKYLKYIQQFKRELYDLYNTKEDKEMLGNLLQDFGDNARRCGNPLDFKTNFSTDNLGTLFILAEEANNIIKFYKTRDRKRKGVEQYSQFVVEAFRNPYEVEYFRNRYYEFYLFSIVAEQNIRALRDNYNNSTDKRDQGTGKEHEVYKQNVRECVHLSDIAISNNSKKNLLETTEKFRRKNKQLPDSVRKWMLKRLYQYLAKHFAIIKQPGCIPPTKDEMFMHQAYSLSVKSNCISRQVGAVIVNQNDFIVGAGWNDVSDGQIGCGLRKYNDLKMNNDIFPVAPPELYKDFKEFISNLNYSTENNFCYKDLYSKFLISSKTKKLQDNNRFKEWKEGGKLSEDDLKELMEMQQEIFSFKKLEYCRALHAEENAILQTAITGGIGIEGATIYTTTFPCELCTKKIFRAGIKRVVYTEPYPESISQNVFFRDGKNKIELHQFEGVKSHSYFRLYKSTIDKKEFQKQTGMYSEQQMKLNFHK